MQQTSIGVGADVAGDRQINNAYAIEAYNDWSRDDRDRTIVQSRGINIALPVSHADNTIDFQTGLWVGNQATLQTTTAYGIVLAGDGSGSDIVFGGGQDANIYYDDDGDVGDGLVINPTTDSRVVFGNGTQDDLELRFDNATNDGVFKWKNTEDRFAFDNDVQLGTDANHTLITSTGDLSFVGTAGF